MIEGLQPYPEYKDSGVAWLGEVPGHWEVRRTKHLLRERVQKGCPDEPLLAATQTKGVVRKEQYENRTVLALKDLHLLKLVEAGDFVISLRSFQGGIEYARERGIISPAYTILYAAQPNTHGYLSWLFKSKPYVENLSLYVTGIRQGQNIDYEKLSRSTLPLPTQSEQSAIVRFLDHADRRIRRYIRAKQKLIKLLEEQKQAIIHRAVTRGLDPDVRLKPSGVEWLGEVPEHWEVKRCRYLFREVDKRSADGLEEHLSMSQRLGLVPSHLVENRTLVSESYEGGKLCEVGDLVLNRLKAHLGVFALAQYAGVISPDYTVLRHIEPGSAEYYERALRSPACRIELRIRAKGIVEGFWRLYTDDFYDIRLPVPPLTERKKIIDHIRMATTEIETGLSLAEREISLMREYRTRLIADVVTGKLDVRAAAASLSEEVEAAPDDTEPLAEDEEPAEEAGA
jgi:type I restriction enzyme S subunit